MLASFATRIAGDLRSLGSSWSIRSRAAGVHALASIAIVSTLLGIVLVIAYPYPLFFASGGVGLALIILAVDVAVGPLLTWIVHDPRKPKRELRRDLCLILALQAGALAYGLHSAILARPVFLTFVVDRFEVLSAAEVDGDELRAAPEALRLLAWGGPVLAGALRPTEAADRERLMFASLHGVDLKHLLSRYVPYERVSDDAIRASRPIGELLGRNDAVAVERALRDLEPREREIARWLPVAAKHEDQVALIDGTTGHLFRVVRLAPW